MERLLKDAEKLQAAKGLDVDYDINNYADIVEAIHAIQEEYGITGATSEEASSTLEGSAASLSASWKNLLTDMGKTDADIDADVKQLCDNIGTYLENLIPVAETAVKNAVDAISKLPGNIKTYFEEHKEEIKTAAEEFFSKVSDAVPYVIDVIMTEVPQIATDIYNWFNEHKDEITEKGKEFFNGLVDSIPVVIENIKTWFDEHKDELAEKGQQLFTGLVKNVSQIVQGLLSGFKSIWESVKKSMGYDKDTSLADIGYDLWTSLTDKIATAAENIVKDLPKILTQIKFWLKTKGVDIANAGVDFLGNLVTNVSKIVITVLGGLGKIVKAIVDELAKKETRDKIAKAGQALFEQLVENGKAIKEKIVNKAKEVVDNLKETFMSEEALKAIWDAGTALFEKLASALGEKKDEVVKKATEVAGDIKKNLEDLITYATGTLKTKWDSAWGALRDSFGTVFSSLTEKVKTPINTIIGFINNVISGVEGAINAVIGGLNTLSIDIPSWVPGFGGSKWGVNINNVSFNRVPQLMAEGGVLRNGGTAIVGEYEPEIIRLYNGIAHVTPLHTGRFGGNGNVYNVNINVYTQKGQSEEEIARMVKSKFEYWEDQQMAVFEKMQYLEDLKRMAAYA